MGISIKEIDVASLSPMMQHYVKTKEEYKDSILFYRLGDFYEMFFDDAETVSRELELTLTGKDCGMAERAPMCGVPFHAAETYINRLISKGYKVAICEQMEDPKQAKGIVRREVIRVVTPGTTLNTQALDETKNNYIMSVVYLSNRFGIAIGDVTTGDFMVTEVENSRKLLDEIYKFSPAELSGRTGIKRLCLCCNCSRGFVYLPSGNAENFSGSYAGYYPLCDRPVYAH